MAVPKRKQSKQRSSTRYANWKIKSPTLVECAQCHELKAPHRVCKKCGFYDGVQRVEIKENKE